MEIKTQRLPMPPDEARLTEAVLRILRLPKLQELKVTLTGLEIKRAVEEDEEVVPETIVEIARGVEPEKPDVEFLLKRLVIEALPVEEARHQLTTLIALTDCLADRNLMPCAWYVTRGDWLDAFLAQSPGTLPRMLFGIPVHYVVEDQLPEGKLLLVGSKTGHSIDAVFGITADIGG